MKRNIAPSTNLVESLRDMGYTLDTALADVVDNSISSGATRIAIYASPETPSRIAIADNGRGMSEQQILQALTLAFYSRDMVRSSNDLGRYGMGMKTASWSQCRRFTILSSMNGVVNAATVDLDQIREQQTWEAEFLTAEQIDALPDRSLLLGNGTLLIWEKLDRVVNDADTKAQTELASKLNQAAEHLEVIFHRFMVSEAPYPKITITINGRELKPFDPFCSKHPATQQSAEEVIPLGSNGSVKVQAFTLPHHDRLSSVENSRLAGPEGYLRNQGFYLYRERRLILKGTWFRLKKPHPSLNLARIRIDIPNSMDDRWHINIIKSSAQPPREVRERLRRIVDTLGSHSQKVYKQKGFTQDQGGLFPVWKTRQVGGVTSYELSDEHPLIRGFIDELSDDHKRKLKSILQLITSSLPLDSISVSIGNAPGSVKGETMDTSSLYELLDSVWDKRPSDNVEELVDLLSTVEPYKSNRDSVLEYFQIKLQGDEE